MSGLRGWRAGVALAAGLAAILATGALVLALILQVLRHRDIVPFWDMVNVEHFLVHLQRFPTLAEAFSYYDNGHRPVFPLYVFAADHFWFSAGGLLPVALSLLSILGVAGISAWRLGRAIEPRPLQLGFALLVFWVLFWPMHYHNLVWTKQFHACFSLLCLAGVFAIAGDIDGAIGSRPPSQERGRLAAMLALIFIGAFSFGWGLLGDAALGAFVLLRRWPLPRALPVLAMLAATGAVYFFTGRRFSAGVPVENLVPMAGEAALYVLSFLGSPVRWLIDHRAVPDSMATTVSMVAGGVAAICSIAVLLRRAPAREAAAGRMRDASGLAWLLVAFGILSALATLKARITLQAMAANNPRYLYAPALLWLALLFHLALSPRRWVRSWLFSAAALVFVAAVIAGLPGIFDDMAGTDFERRWGAVAAVMKEDGARMPPRLNGVPLLVDEVFADYAANGSSVYRQTWPGWLGAQASDVLPAETAACWGGIASQLPVPGSRDVAFAGALWFPGESRTLGWIAAVGRNGRIIGLATTGNVTHWARPASGLIAPARSGFEGYLHGTIDDVAALYLWLGRDRWCRVQSDW